MASLNFNATEVDPNPSFDPIPAGWYDGLIDESSTKPTKANDGAYLQIRIRVLSGPHANRIVFDRLNLENKNPVAVDIAKKTLSQICHATGVMHVTDSQQLHGIPFKFRVKVSQRAGFDPSNEITGYDNINSTHGQPGAGAPTAAAAPRPAAPAYMNGPAAPAPAPAPAPVYSQPAPSYPSAPAPTPSPQYPSAPAPSPSHQYPSAPAGAPAAPHYTQPAQHNSAPAAAPHTPPPAPATHYPQPGEPAAPAPVASAEVPGWARSPQQ